METLLMIVALVVLLILAFLFAGWRTRRNAMQLIDTFRKSNAVGIKNARFPDALGLEPKRIFKIGLRDYKPRALELLQQMGIIEKTEDGRLYLSEESLLSSKFYRNKYER
jgi:hypothetical protein